MKLKNEKCWFIGNIDFTIYGKEIFIDIILGAKGIYALKDIWSVILPYILKCLALPLKYGLGHWAYYETKTTEEKILEHGLQFSCCNGTAVLFFLHRFETFKGNSWKEELLFSAFNKIFSYGHVGPVFWGGIFFLIIVIYSSKVHW